MKPKRDTKYQVDKLVCNIQPATHQKSSAGEKSRLSPAGLRGEKNQLLNQFQEGPQSATVLRSPGSTPSCILVVENNQSVAVMLEVALGTWGYEVCVARNGQEGLAILATHSVDAILLDLNMPVMDGRTMLDEVRWAGYTMPVCVMSGGMETQTLRQLLDEGAQGFLIKPFGLTALQQALAHIFLPIQS